MHVLFDSFKVYNGSYIVIVLFASGLDQAHSYHSFS